MRTRGPGPLRPVARHHYPSDPSPIAGPLPHCCVEQFNLKKGVTSWSNATLPAAQAECLCLHNSRIFNPLSWWGVSRIQY